MKSLPPFKDGKDGCFYRCTEERPEYVCDEFNPGPIPRVLTTKAFPRCEICNKLIIRFFSFEVNYIPETKKNKYFYLRYICKECAEDLTKAYQDEPRSKPPKLG